MTEPKSTIFSSFKNAFRGVYFLFRHERNAQIHLLATAVVIGAGLYYQISATEWFMVALAITLVIITEAINTAIEKTIDFITTERHPQLGKIKDIAAGAVIISAIFAVFIAYLVFWQKIVG